MSTHFEELWEKCEQLHSETIQGDDASTIVDEAIIKLNLYKVIDNQKGGHLKEEVDQAKLRIFGELLSSLTKLSIKDNMDVYKALHSIYEMLSIEHYGNMYKT
jgi:IS1 family transposase